MKGGGGGGTGISVAGKRRWRGLAIGVLFLVVLSMLVPLAFLLGLHNGFHSPNPNGFLPLQQTSILDQYAIRDTFNHYENNRSTTHINEVMDRLAPEFSKNATISLTNRVKNDTAGGNDTRDSQPKRGVPVFPHAAVPRRPNNTGSVVTVRVNESVKGATEENRNCELKFGSYCLWRKEHREDMKDSMVKKLKDQLFVARAYYPSIAKLPSQNKLTRDMKQNIQEFERIFSECATDADLPPGIAKKLQKMEAINARAKSLPVDCSNVDKKLRQIFDMTEDEANFHMKQSAFLYQLAVQTMPKSLHCLSMKLTVECFKSPAVDMEHSQAVKHSDPLLHHYVIFSKNVLASSVVINSTVTHARESRNQVFHVVTDGQNYFAMKLWFFRNTFKQATVRVLNIEQLNLEYHVKAIDLHLSLPVEFRVAFHSVENTLTTHDRTQYMSIFSHAHYLLPEIFPSLKKVIVLDDDIVVQKDLSVLWNLNMGGKVNGAIELCSVRLGQLRNYLGDRLEKNSCAWMSGLNLVDLVKWRELDLTKIYQSLVREVSLGEGSTEAVALHASLLTFQDQIYALDSEWALSGLGHDYGLDIQAIEKAAVLHYNGNMKPWLELGIPRYRLYWKKFLNQEDRFLSECNVNP